jgi:hypothetical protein
MDTKTTAIEAIFNGVKSLTIVQPILSYMGTCVKRLVEPYWIRYEKNREAETKELLIKEHPLERLEYMLKLIKENQAILPEKIKDDIFNAVKIGQLALEFLNADAQNKKFEDNVIEDEWIDRFVDEAKYVSDEELQRLFARLLKEKICNPGAINKRVVDIIRNIDSSELEIIKEYMSYFVSGSLSSEIISNASLSIENVSDLANMGLMNYVVVPAMHVVESSFEITPEFDTIEAKGYKFVFSDIKNKIVIHFESQYALTKEGKIVFNLVAAPMPDNIRDMYKNIFERQCKEMAKLTVIKDF